MMVYPRVRQRAAGAVYRRGNPASAGWGQGRRGERAGPGGRSVGRLAALGRRGARDNTGRQWAGTFSRATADARDISVRTVAGWPVYPGGK